MLILSQIKNDHGFVVIFVANTVLMSGFAPGYYVAMTILFTKNSE